MKNHHHNGPISPQPNSPEQIHRAISTRAHELWEQRGRPDNQSDSLWLEAELELVNARTGSKLPTKQA